jgi:uncharacterized membrane protein YkvA (DUF1232 family)
VSTLSVVLAVVVGFVVLWLLVVGLMWVGARRQSRRSDLREMVRLVPDVAPLVTRLARDSSLPGGVRLRLALLLGYLALPIDLVPDVVPVVGYADDVVVVALVLRSVVRRAGPDAIERHWPGTPDGLAAVLRLAGVRGAA